MAGRDTLRLARAEPGNPAIAPMRKLIVTILTSLDGYVAGPGADFMAMPLDGSFSAYNLERPHLRHPVARPYDANGVPVILAANGARPRQPAIEREISRRNTTARKVVVSDSLDPDDLAGWGESELVRRDAALDAVRRLKVEDGANIIAFGNVPVYKRSACRVRRPLPRQDTLTSCRNCPRLKAPAPPLKGRL